MVKARKWICSCPDRSKRLNSITTLSETWSQFTRDWSNSSAGARVDCKHIMNAKLINNIQVGPFEDEPITEKQVSTFRKGSINNFTFKRPGRFKK